MAPQFKETEQLLDAHLSQHAATSPGVEKNSNISPRDDVADSTDVSKIDITSRRSNAGYKPQPYDWAEVAHLFEDGAIPDELRQVTDPIEFNYLLVRLKKDFNDKNKSEYIKYMGLQLPYHSRRDEVGGQINKEDWNNFVDRLEGIIDKVKKKRRRIINRRKKKGNKKMPRKTLFKPEKRPNLAKDPLWREVFIDSSESEESFDEENMSQLDFFDAYSKVGRKGS